MDQKRSASPRLGLNATWFCWEERERHSFSANVCFFQCSVVAGRPVSSRATSHFWPETINHKLHSSAEAEEAAYTSSVWCRQAEQQRKASPLALAAPLK